MLKQMKNVLKRISAIAMAFTLLGTGTAVTKKVNPTSIPTLGAHACLENELLPYAKVPSAYAQGVTHRCCDYRASYIYNEPAWIGYWYYTQDVCAICGSKIGEPYDKGYSLLNWL